MFAAVTLAAMAQAYALFGNVEANPETVVTWKNFPGWLAWSGLSPLFGAAVFPDRPTYAAVVGCAVAFVALASGLIGLSVSWRVKIGVLLGFAFIILTAVVSKYGDSLMPAINPYGGGQRYFYIPYAMIAWTLFILAAKARRYWNIVGLVALALCIGSSARFFVAPPMEDLRWRERVEALEDEGDVPINPSGNMVHIFRNR